MEKKHELYGRTWSTNRRHVSTASTTSDPQECIWGTDSVSPTECSHTHQPYGQPIYTVSYATKAATRLYPSLPTGHESEPTDRFINALPKAGADVTVISTALTRPHSREMLKSSGAGALGTSYVNVTERIGGGVKLSTNVGQFRTPNSETVGRNQLPVDLNFNSNFDIMSSRASFFHGGAEMTQRTPMVQRGEERQQPAINTDSTQYYEKPYTDRRVAPITTVASSS